MNRLNIGAAILLAGGIGGCALRPETPADVVGEPAKTDQSVIAERAAGAVAIGRSTRADVIAALGETAVLRFDSGYEVWVYRLLGAPADPRAARTERAEPEKAEHDRRAELIILFAPSGRVAKTRIRHAS